MEVQFEPLLIFFCLPFLLTVQRFEKGESDVRDFVEILLREGAEKPIPNFKGSSAQYRESESVSCL
jgi:hypothetical protein